MPRLAPAAFLDAKGEGLMYQDDDPIETSEWLEALESLMENEGIDRVKYILERLSERASGGGTELPYSITTRFRNTIAATQEARMPGDLFMERRIRSLIRWNAMAMVVRANKRPGDLGGHISTFSSAATLYDVGFNYFFHGGRSERASDLVYFQGHAAPGIYARSFLEGRFTDRKSTRLNSSHVRISYAVFCLKKKQ